MEPNTFDRLTRTIGAQSTRRGVVKAAAGGTLAAIGIGAAGRAALGQQVTAEDGFKGDSCDNSSDCRKGLICNSNTNRCEYKSNCGGKKGAACKNNGQCCDNRNLTCNNRKCKRDKRNN